MHCPSCAVNIDLSLEDIAGITAVDTSYPTGKTKITYDADRVKPADIQQAITNLGYQSMILE